MNCFQESRITTVLITFFNKHGVDIQRICCLKDEHGTVNSDCVLRMLLKHILQGCQLCLHDNDTVHSGSHLILNACQVSIFSVPQMLGLIFLN
jgi:hypothetical protein